MAIGLFQKFVDYLNGKGLIFNEGRVVDASFVSVPKQRNTPDENKRIKAGEGDGLWKPEEGDSEENTMHRLCIRMVGLARATAVIGLINLTYNMFRYGQIVRLNLLKE